MWENIILHFSFIEIRADKGNNREGEIGGFPLHFPHHFAFHDRLPMPFLLHTTIWIKDYSNRLYNKTKV